MEQLQLAFERRGFLVGVSPRAVMTVVNGETAGDTSAGKAMNPGLRQNVALGPDPEAHDSGDLAWFWMWSGAARTDPPEYERITAVGAIAEVVERTSRILAPANVERSAEVKA